MTILDKAIRMFGFESPITITIAVLCDRDMTDLAESLYSECLELCDVED